MRSVLAFTGETRDRISVSYPLGHGYRWYLPALMRFNAPDSWSPFGLGGPNPYTYCGSEPVNRRDPSGHVLIIPDGSGVLPEIENIDFRSYSDISGDLDEGIFGKPEHHPGGSAPPSRSATPINASGPASPDGLHAATGRSSPAGSPFNAGADRAQAQSPPLPAMLPADPLPSAPAAPQPGASRPLGITYDWDRVLAVAKMLPLPKGQSPAVGLTSNVVDILEVVERTAPQIPGYPGIQVASQQLGYPTDTLDNVALKNRARKGMTEQAKARHARTLTAFDAWPPYLR